MKIDLRFKTTKKFYGTEGNVLVSREEDFFLIIRNTKDHFEVFDLKHNTPKVYKSVEEFDNHFPIEEEFLPNEISLVLEK